MTKPRRAVSCRGLVQLAHPGPAVACTALTVMAGRSALRAAAITAPGSRRRLVMAAAAMFLAQISTGSLNDYCDRVADRRHQPYKPIAKGLVPAPIALAFAASTAALSATMAAALGAAAGGWMILGLACGWAYDVRLSRTPWSFAPFVVGIVTVPWVGMAAVGARARRPALTSLLAALLGFGLHLANGGPDAVRDRQAGRRSLPSLLGAERCKGLTQLLLTVAAALVGLLAPPATRPAARRRAAAALVILAWDRHQNRPHRSAGQHPFVLPVLAAGILAAGWLASPRRAFPDEE